MFARLTLLLLCVAWAIALPASLQADDFRIVTKVYNGERGEPDSENTTLFRGGVVYDFLSEPKKVTIFDPNRGRFVMLDSARQVQTEVTLAEVQKFNKELAQWASEKKDELLNSLAKPQFQQKQDPDTGATLFTSATLAYAVKTAPAASRQMFEQYDEFANLFVQLNNMLSLPVRPPYGLARLAVNQELRKKGEIPSEVKLTVFGSKIPLLGKNLVLRSQHQVTPMVSDSDAKEIIKVQQQLTGYKKVALEEFLAVPKMAQRQK